MKKLPRIIVSIGLGLTVDLALSITTSWFVVTYLSRYEGPAGGYQILTDVTAQTFLFIIFSVIYLPIFAFPIYKYLGKKIK